MDVFQRDRHKVYFGDKRFDGDSPIHGLYLVGCDVVAGAGAFGGESFWG